LLSLCTCSLAMLLASCASSSGGAVQAQEPPKIFAHYMGCFPIGTGAIEFHAGQQNKVLMRDLRERDGWPGDVRRDYGFTPRGERMSLQDSVDLEMRRAMRIGIDGFAIDAWAGHEGARDVLEKMFEVAAANAYDFELTVAIDPMCQLPGTGGMHHHARQTIKWLVDNYGDHPNLARRNGKPLIFGYQSRLPALQYWWDVMWSGDVEGYPSGPDMKARGIPREEQVKKISDAVNRMMAEDQPTAWRLTAEFWGSHMAEHVGQPIYKQLCLFNFGALPDGNDPAAIAEMIAALGKGVDAVGFFVNHNNQLSRDVAEGAQKAGVEWGYPVALQYQNYGAQWFWGTSGIERLRQTWQQARETNSTLIQYITWNDYNEDTNLGPGWNTRYAYYDLTDYFIRWWKAGKEPEPERDKLYIFSYKYPYGAETWPFESRKDWDRKMEIVAILTEPGTLRVPHRGDDGGDAVWEAPAGLSFRQLELTPGAISVDLIRNEETVLTLKHPEPVTDRPFRQDLGITAISTECERHWEQDFGEDEPFFAYSEYGDQDGDGLPNWYELLYFGDFNDMQTATNADPDEDASGDGLTNLEAYRNRVHPISQ